MPARHSRRLLPLLPLTLLAACGGKAPDAFRTDTVTRGAVVEQVSATGEVGAITIVNVGSQVSGTIKVLYVDFNSQVKKGQILAQIDPRLFAAALERAEAAVAAARAQVEKSEAALADARRVEARSRELFEARLTSRADLDTATANREQAQAQVSVSKAQVMQARADRDTAAANLAYTRILSPIDGIVVSRAVDVGQTVAASFQTPTLFTIANDLTKMQILANIDEADVGKVREGMEAKFTVDAWPGETFRGRIREVRQAPTTIQNVVTYAAVIDAPNPDRKLRQGMTAQVQVSTGRRDDVLRVANAALRYKPANAAAASAEKRDEKKAEKPAEGTSEQRTDKTLASARGERGGLGPAREGGRPEGGEGRPGEGEGGRKARMGRVYKLQDGKPVAVAVRLGLSDAQRAEVLDGLAEGDVVVIGEGGGMGLPPGMGGPLGGARPQGGARRGF